MIIATCSYAKFTPDMGVPIRATYGDAPAGQPYKLRHHVAELAPDLGMTKMTYEDFATAYRRKLLTVGILAATRAVHGIMVTERADPDTTAAVFLTGTDLARPGSWCSRTMLAAWLTEHHGGLVAELGGLPPAGAYAPPLAGTLLGGVDAVGTTAMF